VKSNNFILNNYKPIFCLQILMYIDVEGISEGHSKYRIRTSHFKTSNPQHPNSNIKPLISNPQHQTRYQTQTSNPITNPITEIVHKKSS
jgi:hypothetical protein